MLSRLFRKHLRRQLSFQRYHKQWAVMGVVMVVLSTLVAVEQQADGSWALPLVWFYLAFIVFVIGSLELITLAFGHFKKTEDRLKAVSRTLSCYGFVVTALTMCDLYDYMVHF